MLLLLLLMLHQLADVDAEADAAGERHVVRCLLTLTAHSRRREMRPPTMTTTMMMTMTRSPPVAGNSDRARDRVLDDAHTHVKERGFWRPETDFQSSLSLSLGAIALQPTSSPSHVYSFAAARNRYCSNTVCHDSRPGDSYAHHPRDIVQFDGYRSRQER